MIVDDQTTELIHTASKLFDFITVTTMPSLLLNSLCEIWRHKILYRRISQNNNYVVIQTAEGNSLSGRQIISGRTVIIVNIVYLPDKSTGNTYICAGLRRERGGVVMAPQRERSWWPTCAFNKGYGRPSLRAEMAGINYWMYRTATIRCPVSPLVTDVNASTQYIKKKKSNRTVQ